jgi:ABC-type glycerol-3-phosphate transport system permease component
MTKQAMGRSPTKDRSAQLVEYFQLQHVRERITKAIIYILLILGSILVMLPLLWMISTSLKKPGTEFTIPVQWIPNPPRLAP